MFGYVTVSQDDLKVKEYKRYRGFYCGLCRALHKKYGRTGQLALTYDMTFLSMLLNGLYEPPLHELTHRCLVHPVQKQTFLFNEITEYAADMSVLLAYYKELDNVIDEKSLRGRAYTLITRRQAKKIAENYPRQAEAVREQLGELQIIEDSNTYDLDRSSGCFGKLLAELFVFREDVWSEDLRRMGFFLGKFIYLLDAYDDLEKDLKKHNYNPWQPERERKDFDALVENTLTMMIAESARAFERLPILQDAEILRNILYAGVWARFREVADSRSGQ